MSRDASIGPMSTAQDDAYSETAFRRDLTDAVSEAHLPSLLAVLTQLTGDLSLLDGPFRPRRVRGPGDHDDGGLSPQVQEQLRAAAIEAVIDHRAGRLRPARELGPSDVLAILSACLGEEVPAEEAGMLAEELGVVSRQVPALTPDDAPRAPHALIVGAGFSGLCAAIRLAEAGFDYTIVERNPEVGGTWYENTYPGCGVDTPVHLYSFSFTQSSDWPTYFARQPEMHKYLISVADDHGVRDHIRFETRLESAAWDEDARQWNVCLRLADGSVEQVETPVVISAVGLFSKPAVPVIPGLDDFPGPVLHTSRWRDDVDLRGKRVAVIGSGASAMQLVPAIADDCAHVTVFQRSPQWIIPNPNTTRPVSPAKQYLMRHVPYYLGWYRLRQAWTFGDRLHPMLRIDPDWPHQDRSINADNERHRVFLTRYIEEQLAGRPDLIANCVPTYPPYGKRPLLDHGWYETLKRPDVALVPEGAACVDGDAVVTASGARSEVDVIVLATGFTTLDLLGSMDIRGREGRTLRETWGPDDARALLGMTVPGFPNFFILYGPNTNAGHGGSHVLSVEMQVRYVLKLLTRMAREELTSIECRTESFETFNAELDEALALSIWSHPGMSTYYRNARGRIVTNVPWTNGEYWRRTHEPALDDFTVTGA